MAGEFTIISRKKGRKVRKEKDRERNDTVVTLVSGLL